MRLEEDVVAFSLRDKLPRYVSWLPLKLSGLMKRTAPSACHIGRTEGVELDCNLLARMDVTSIGGRYPGFNSWQFCSRSCRGTDDRLRGYGLHSLTASAFSLGGRLAGGGRVAYDSQDAPTKNGDRYG